MNEIPRVILSGFADESANNKTASEQFVDLHASCLRASNSARVQRNIRGWFGLTGYVLMLYHV